MNPYIRISGASISPKNSAVQDFTNPVVYTVKAEDGSKAQHTVTVVKDNKYCRSPSVTRDNNGLYWLAYVRADNVTGTGSTG